jgi:predicted ribosome quality control (RQC) complex YloA/Tae2 family protein
MIVKLRQHKTSTNKLVLLGRTADTNEELVKQLQKNEIVLHTAQPGSPFANIKAPENEVVKSEIYEAAVMCAKYSQDWRDNKKDVKIHVFSGADVFKTLGMSNGTFGVKKYKEIIAKKEDIIKFERTVQK